MTVQYRRGALRKAGWPPRDAMTASARQLAAEAATICRQSFWGAPKVEPMPKDVARLVTVIREACARRSDDNALELATATLHATAAYLAHRFQPREALAVIDRVRAEILGEG
jgi:hypothetical protein